MIKKNRGIKHFRRDLLTGMGIMSLIVVVVLSYSAVQAERRFSKDYIKGSVRRARDAFAAWSSDAQPESRAVLIQSLLILMTPRVAFGRSLLREREQRLSSNPPCG